MIAFAIKRNNEYLSNKADIFTKNLCKARFYKYKNKIKFEEIGSVSEKDCKVVEVEIKEIEE